MVAHPSIPDLSVIQSSPMSTRQFNILKLEHESGFIPSVFGELGGFIIITELITIFLQRIGVTVHAGEFKIVIFSILIFSLF